MPYVTYDEIRDLCDYAEQDMGAMKCWFKCPRTGTVVETRGNIPRTLAHGMANEAMRSGLSQLLSRVTALVRRHTGMYIPLGAAMTQANRGNVIATDAGRRAAIVDAFEQIAVYPGKPVQPGRFNHVDGAWRYVER